MLDGSLLELGRDPEIQWGSWGLYEQLATLTHELYFFSLLAPDILKINVMRIVRPHLYFEVLRAASSAHTQGKDQ